MIMRKAIPAALIAVFCVISMAAAAGAQDDTAGATRPASSFEHGKFGLGVIFGEPSGLSAKMWTTKTTAFDLGLAWSFSGDGNFHIHGDYLFHKFGVFDVSKGSLPIYIGLGARILFQDDTKVGIRLPVGLEYYFDGWPLAVFGEIVPILDLAPDTKFDINGGIGLRFYF
jgi:hypothetical protein